MERVTESGANSPNFKCQVDFKDDTNNNHNCLTERLPSSDVVISGISYEGDINHNQADSISDTSEMLDNAPLQNINKEMSYVNPAGTRNLRDRKRRLIIHEKVRHKRQTLQDMARPLKHWLCKHRNNPYPTKSDKSDLAKESSMTLIQVSNWFANARRRLKSTVTEPGLTWQARIQQYNSKVKGNAELLSISSDDSIWNSEDEVGNEITDMAFHSNTHSLISNSLPGDSDRELVPSRSQTPTDAGGHVSLLATTVNKGICMEDIGSPLKFKQTILQRYLTDSYRNVDASQPVSFDEDNFTKPRMRRQSGSLGSRDYEELSTSSGASVNDYHHGVFDDIIEEQSTDVKRRRVSERIRKDEEMYWKEISAAMALTSLARSRKNP